MAVNFELCVRAEFATMHLVREQGIKGAPILHMKMGYQLQVHDKLKWQAIQDAYACEIRTALRCGWMRPKDFVYKSIDSKA